MHSQLESGPVDGGYGLPDPKQFVMHVCYPASTLNEHAEKTENRIGLLNWRKKECDRIETPIKHCEKESAKMKKEAKSSAVPAAS